MAEITEAEFLKRFTAFLIKYGGEAWADGEPMENYAKDVAPAYWGDASQREDGPEACAEADMSCWEYDA